MHFNFRTAFQVTCWLFSPSLPFIFITSVPLVFRAGRHTHVFGLHLFTRYLDLPQIFQRSFKNFLPPSLFTRYLDSRSFRPTLQFSTDLHRSSQIYLAIHPLFIHFCLPITLSPRSSQIFYRSSTDLSKIFQKFPFLHPLSLRPGQSVIPAHSSDHQAFRFPLF